MYNEIAANKRKTWFIMASFVAFVGLLGYGISAYYFQSPSATIMVLFGAIAYAAFSYFNAGKMATAVNGAREVSEADAPRLYRTVENLAITEGMPMPKVYIIDDPAMNAFATGRNPQNAIVAATTGLLNALDDSELEGVMAHELGHVKNYDIRVSMIAFALVTVVALLTDLFTRSLWFGGRSDNNRGSGGMLVVVALVAAVLAPLIANMLKLAVTRRREYLADATGAMTTRYPEGLASALQKIGNQGSVMRRQNTATAHLFFANPLSKGNFAKLFSTHPPIEDRIAKLRSMDIIGGA